MSRSASRRGRHGDRPDAPAELARGRRARRRRCSPRSTSQARTRARPPGGSPAVASLDELLDPTRLIASTSSTCARRRRCTRSRSSVPRRRGARDLREAAGRLGRSVRPDRDAASARSPPPVLASCRSSSTASATVRRKARALIDAGMTGRLFTASASTWWRRGKGYYAEAPWRGTWAGERGGCVLSHAIHNHDMLTWIGGTDRRSAGTWRPPG